MGMIPIGDDDSDRTVTPLVNYVLIAVNIAVFALLQGMGGNDRVVAGMGLLGGGSQAGGVAYAAHVGGFVAGLALVKMFAAGHASR